MTFLDVRGLRSSYGRIEALHGVTLSVARGEVVALVGANGAGKSTLLRSISGIHACDAEHLHFSDVDLRTLTAAKRVRAGVSQVPEGRQVFGPMSVEDNILMGGFTRERAEVQASMHAMYGLFPMLSAKRRQPASQLSGGQQQMLAMARALMARPQLLLLDEPSMGLAPLVVAEIFSLIRTLRDQGTTVLVVEQNARAALGIADRGYVMELGRIVLTGTGAALLADASVQRAYLGM